MDIKKYAIIDLHLHLDGALSPEAIIEVARKESITLPTNEPQELKKYLSVDETCSSLTDYLTKFDLPNLVLQSKEGLRFCTLDLLKRLHEQGLKYVEIRMAPQLSTAKGLTQEEVVETLIDALKDGEKAYGIKSNLILCMMRGPQNDINMLTCNVAKKYLGKGVVAVDIAGDERAYDNEKMKDMLAYINKLELPFTVHSGESVGHESIDYALRFNPQRIGHGVRSIESEDTLKEIRDKGIYLEVCPTSNVDTKAFERIEDVPVKKLMDAGILVTINTDDPTVSDVTLAEEYENLRKSAIFDQDIKQIAINSVNASFLSNEEKNELIQYLNSLN